MKTDIGFMDAKSYGLVSEQEIKPGTLKFNLCVSVLRPFSPLFPLIPLERGNKALNKRLTVLILRIGCPTYYLT